MKSDSRNNQRPDALIMIFALAIAALVISRTVRVATEQYKDVLTDRPVLAGFDIDTKDDPDDPKDDWKDDKDDWKDDKGNEAK